MNKIIHGCLEIWDFSSRFWVKVAVEVEVIYQTQQQQQQQQALFAWL